MTSLLNTNKPLLEAALTTAAQPEGHNKNDGSNSHHHHHHTNLLVTITTSSDLDIFSITYNN